MIIEKEERDENRDLPLKCSWMRILGKQKNKQTKTDTKNKAFLSFLVFRLLLPQLFEG